MTGRFYICPPVPHRLKRHDRPGRRQVARGLVHGRPRGLLHEPDFVNQDHVNQDQRSRIVAIEAETTLRPCRHPLSSGAWRGRGCRRSRGRHACLVQPGRDGLAEHMRGHPSPRGRAPRRSPVAGCPAPAASRFDVFDGSRSFPRGDQKITPCGPVRRSSVRRLTSVSGQSLSGHPHGSCVDLCGAYCEVEHLVPHRASFTDPHSRAEHLVNEIPNVEIHSPGVRAKKLQRLLRFNDGQGTNRLRLDRDGRGVPHLGVCESSRVEIARRWS